MMGFFMSFLLLIMALYGFQIVSQDASDTETRAIYTDIAGRVANAVLSASDVGARRVASASTALSSEILYQQRMLLPVEVHGEQYRVTLTAAEVRVESESGRLRADAITFNLQTGTCSSTTPVCGLTGTYLSSTDGLLVKYEYKPTPSTTCTSVAAPVLNCVTIS